MASMLLWIMNLIVICCIVQGNWKLELLQHLDSKPLKNTPSPTINPTIPPRELKSIDYVDSALLNVGWVSHHLSQSLLSTPPQQHNEDPHKPNSSSARSLQASSSSSSLNEHNNNHLLSNTVHVEGFYKGIYFNKEYKEKKEGNKTVSIPITTSKPKTEQQKESEKDGNCVLIINRIHTLEINDYYKKLDAFLDSQKDNNTNSNNDKNNSLSSKWIITSSELSSTKLMLLNEEYKRDLLTFWFGIYDKYNGIILLSNYNFSYNIFLHNISFTEINQSLIESNKICPSVLTLDIRNENKINGNLTKCNLNISLNDLLFIEHDEFQREANEYGIASLCIVLLSFYFLFKQYEYSASLGRVIKISFLTLYLQFIWNGVICFIHFDVAMNVESLFTTFLVISFIGIMNANLYLRMMKQIWSHHYPLTNQQNLKLYNFVKILSFIFILFLSQYIIIGKYAFFIYFILLSDWTCQIFHNVKSGQVLSWKLNVIVFNTVSKLFFPLYIYGCPRNIIQNKPNYSFCVLITFWSIIQILILYSQDMRLNSRWFIPEKMRPQRYKYHKTPNYNIDSDDDDDDTDYYDEEDNDVESCRNDHKDKNSDDLSQKTNKKKSKQCSICLEHINWKKEYKHIMVTPCKHWFHDDCLRQWMVHRLSCPTCRTELPPCDF